MKNNGAPGPDKINAYAIKKLPSTHTFLVNAFVDAFDNNKPLPNWLVKGKTILLPKNQETGIAKNYRLIACLNITYKLYTSLLNKFLENHCTTNNIITMEQAGGKKHSWGCADQLLINKMVLDQVKQQRKNLFMMWFDYRKAFDSVPHSWIIKALHLAKVPEKVLNAILRLMELWATKVNLFAEGTNIETESINYLTGVLQGDCLSLMLFILSVNPLSFMLSLLPGYNIGKPNSSKVNISHLFFVDDLKTFAKNKNEATLHLDLFTRFTNDINMKFGLDKCAYIYIERGKRKSLGTKLTINNIEISELESEDTYKYLGQDEDIGFKGELNKQRVMEEYLKRVRKIWNSELYSRNKVLAHNIFAIPVLSPTFGILDWTKQELENLDIKTRKILTASGSFHINSDVDRLYCYRKNGGRGLNSIVDTFISRIVSLSLHLKNPRYDNRFLKHVLTHETERLIRVAENLLSNFSVEFQEGIQEAENSTKVVNMAIKRKIKENHLHEWICKTQHGYLERSRKNVPNIDKNNTEIWLKKAPLSSHIEGYIFAIQEEEINTNLLVAKRDGDRNTNCRLCKKEKKSI